MFLLEATEYLIDWRSFRTSVSRVSPSTPSAVQFYSLKMYSYSGGAEAAG